MGLEWSPLSLVSTTEEPFERKSSGFGLENREYSRRDMSCWPCGILYPQKLELTSPTSGGHSVGRVHSRTQATEFFPPPDIKFKKQHHNYIHIQRNCMKFMFKISVLLSISYKKRVKSSREKLTFLWERSENKKVLLYVYKLLLCTKCNLRFRMLSHCNNCNAWYNILPLFFFFF
jgi:hypothetical protein